MPPVIAEEQCNACGICVEVCNYDVYFASRPGETPEVTYPEECWHCNGCVLDCPEGAIRLRVPLPAMMLYK